MVKLRKSKLFKQNKHKLNKRLKVIGRTKQQRKNIKMKNAIDLYNGDVVGNTLKEKYQDMHKQIAFANAEKKRLEEKKLKNKKGEKE